MTKKIKQLEKENKELQEIILDLKSKENKTNNVQELNNEHNDDELTGTYIIPRTII